MISRDSDDEIDQNEFHNKQELSKPTEISAPGREAWIHWTLKHKG